MNATTTTAAPAHISLAAKTGPRFLAGLFHWGLFGILTIQVYLYFIAFPNDPKKNRIFVFIVYVLEVLQTVMMTISVFTVFAAGFGDPSVYDNVELVWFTVPLMSGVVAFLAEGFYAYRIFVLAQSYWVPALVVFLAVVQLVGAIASSVVVKQAHLFSHLLGRKFFITEGVWNGGSASCDVVIAVAMTYYLSRRGNGAMKSTRTMLRRVITRVIETGTVTAVFAIVTMSLTFLPGHQTYYQVPSAILAKIYSNSMMVLFNSRIKIGPDTSDSERINTTDYKSERVHTHDQMVFAERNLISTKGQGMSFISSDDSSHFRMEQRKELGVDTI